MNRGGVWWVEFDPAMGSEIQKTRPAVIVSNDIANTHLPRVVVVPLTSNVSKLYPGEALVSLNGKKGKALADQIRSVDKSRLRERIGVLSKADMSGLEMAINVHLALIWQSKQQTSKPKRKLKLPFEFYVAIKLKDIGATLDE